VRFARATTGADPAELGRLAKLHWDGAMFISRSGLVSDQGNRILMVLFAPRESQERS